MGSCLPSFSCGHKPDKQVMWCPLPSLCVPCAGSEVDERIFCELRERLPQVALESHGRAVPSISPSPALFGVVQRMETSNYGRLDAEHTDQQMYSCGSLAPKMKKGGCMNAAFHRAAKPWERSEG